MLNITGEEGTNSGNVFLGTPTHEYISVRRPAKTYIYLLCVDRLEDLPTAMASWDG